MARLEIKLGEREIFMKVNLFEGEEEIDIDKILKVDIMNLTAEILTFPVILNKLGISLAEKQNQLKEKRLAFEIWQSQESQKIKKTWSEDKNRPIVRGGKYTNDDVSDYIVSHKLYKVYKQSINKVEKEVEIMNSIYWAAKDKSDKLQKLSLILKSDDIDLDNIVSTFNGVSIKAKSPAIK